MQSSNELPCCDHNTTLNTLRNTRYYNEYKPECLLPTAMMPEMVPRKFFRRCDQIDPCERNTNCCTMSPILTTPLPRVDYCEKPKPVNQNFCCCNTSANDCGNFGLTMYGKEHVLKTGRLIKKCLCTKFNGLQDTCKHPGCCAKVGCLICPFPTCPPAQKWKCDAICRNKTPDCC